MKKSCGFPNMNKEISEKRAFLPTFFGELKEENIVIYLENGYGNKMGFTIQDYLDENENIIFTTSKEVYSKDIIVVLRAPIEEELMSMKKGSVLISMLHYETRESRNLLMEQLEINLFSMDSMVDDYNRRIVVNSYGTAFNGAKIALEQLHRKLSETDLHRPVNIVIVGMGNIGLTVAKAFKDLSNEQYKKLNGKYGGLKIIMLTRSITDKHTILIDELKNADILVDASFRLDTSKYIVNNAMIKVLPSHTVILDITADPYDFIKQPPQVKGIEGIPTGTLDQTIFDIDDKVYDEINELVSTIERRLVVSCNAWPGVDPVTSQKLYGRQLLPIMKVLINKGCKNLDIDSKNYYERILYKSSYEYYKIKSSKEV